MSNIAYFVAIQILTAKETNRLWYRELRAEEYNILEALDKITPDNNILIRHRHKAPDFENFFEKQPGHYHVKAAQIGKRPMTENQPIYTVLIVVYPELRRIHRHWRKNGEIYRMRGSTSEFYIGRQNVWYLHAERKIYP